MTMAKKHKTVMGGYVAYCRVSTDMQGAAGLGMQAQQAAVQAYLTSVGAPDGQPVRWFIEVESGKVTDRPELQAAIALCKERSATLVVAKLDRLARNLAFIATLMESRVEFVCCDMPHANKLTIQVLAAVAEHEREMISSRTKAALASVKAKLRANGSTMTRGNSRLGIAPREITRLGAGDPLPGAAAAGEVNAAKADAFADRVRPLVEGFRKSGMSYRDIAAELNKRGEPTRNGGGWHSTTVRNILLREVA
jgi:DNA invertase Pin-like site-specific DNA recombinase